ncbi:MAG: nucleotidyltransferase domain-containing protein [Candidatus Woesearchaeota archaeon]
MYQEYDKNIVDVILFGSVARGKDVTHDTDVAIILKNTEALKILELQKKFNAFFPQRTHLNLVLIENILSNVLYRTLLLEGFSLLTGKRLCEQVGFSSGALISFSLVSLEKSKKVLFYYALHGKKKHGGLLRERNGRILARNVIFVPLEAQDEFQDFFEQWAVEYYLMKILRT